MASNINANNIDSTYPVAGVDNDSQGFRTNFTNIKNNLSYAKTELEDLQSKVMLKQALTGTTLDNSMSGAVISGATIQDFRETEIDLTSSTGTITLDHTAGHYHKVSNSGGSITIAFTGFPTAGKIGRIRLKVTVTTTANTLTFPSAVSLGTSTIDGYSSNVITFPATGTYYFEFITDDAGASIHVQDLTRPRKNTATSTTWGNSSVTTFDRFTYSNVTTGFTTSVTNTLLIDSISTLATGTVYLPTSPTDGQIVKIAANNAITALTLTANTGTVLGKVTTLAANSHVSYQYVAGPSKWFRIEN
jgi:hypothetical protein